MATPTIPTTEPDPLVAGATWTWKRTFSDYPASSWTLTYYFLLETGSTAFNFAATADGDDFLVDETPATTATRAAGKYQWQAFVTDGTDKFLVDRGCSEIIADFTTSTADPRSHTQKVFDALKAVVEGKATKDLLETEINSKKLKRMSWSEILTAYNHFKNLVTNECIEAENMDNPSALAESRTIRHTFGRPE
jgi:hypothetical protein